MASNHGNTPTEPAKMEQIITQIFAKTFHIIMESRSPYMSSRNFNFSAEQIVSSPSSVTSPSPRVRPRDKWFNLSLRECPAVLDNFDIWSKSNLDPLVVDVILVERPLVWNDQDELACKFKSERLIERWIVQYECKRARDTGSGSGRSSNTLHILYKKSILLLRSLYLTVRLLPAYKIFQDLNSSGQVRTYHLSHKVSSFAEPLSLKEEAEMQRFGFTPVETSCGRLCLSVLYHSSLSDVSSESSTPVSPRFIPDYVGSPLADPVKRFPSLPVLHGSPSSLPFSRRHSWSYDHHKASPPSSSPSPTYSEPHASISNPNTRYMLPMNLPPHRPEISILHKKNTSFDEYSPSPSFTPSPSPSPPIYIPASNLSKALLRSESAPVSIPLSKVVGSPVLSNKQILPPSPIRSGKPKTDKSTVYVPAGASVEKFFSHGKYDAKRHSGMKLSSNCSTQKSVSRSSSRSYQYDFDDSDFPCPFDVEEDDLTDPSSRPGSFDQKGHFCDQLEPGGIFPIRKSQDAAVGALVNMLKKAPPLCQDFSASVDYDSRSKFPNSDLQNIQISDARTIQPASLTTTSSGLVAIKTTADALDELRGYKEIKESLLLKHAGRSNT